MRVKGTIKSPEMVFDFHVEDADEGVYSSGYYDEIYEIKEIFVRVPMDAIMAMTPKVLETFQKTLREKARMALESAIYQAVLENKRIDAARREQYKREENEKKASRKKSGYIYLLRSETGLYKIGKAISVPQRASEIERQSPVPIEVIHFFPSNDYSSAEASLHTKYANTRVRGEWFKLTEKEVSEICAMEEFNL